MELIGSPRRNGQRHVATRRQCDQYQRLLEALFIRNRLLSRLST